MVKVLLVEPEKILQQAISLALFPDHEVQVEKTLGPEATGALKDYDLLIIDGIALRETGQLTPDVARAIQGCKTPTLWLEEGESSHPPERDKLVVLKKPIEREAFQSALAQLLPLQAGARESRVPQPATGEKPESGKAATKKKRETKQETFGFIDLVDVVEKETTQK